MAWPRIGSTMATYESLPRSHDEKSGRPSRFAWWSPSLSPSWRMARSRRISSRGTRVPVLTTTPVTSCRAFGRMTRVFLVAISKPSAFAIRSTVTMRSASFWRDNVTDDGAENVRSSA